MTPLVETHLALLLFLPWGLILGLGFWKYPSRPRHRARRLFDTAALAAAALAFIAGMRHGLALADPGYGRIWQQIVATSLGYGAFLSALLAAFLLRRRWLRAGKPG